MQRLSKSGRPTKDNWDLAEEARMPIQAEDTKAATNYTNYCSAQAQFDQFVAIRT
jgi:hypothetical protein